MMDVPVTSDSKEPGGYLQWGEMDHSTHRFQKSRDDLSLKEITRAGEYPSTLKAQDSRLDQKYACTCFIFP